MDSDGEIAPFDRAGSNGTEKNLALAEQRNVNRLADRGRCPDALCNVYKADAALQHSLQIVLIDLWKAAIECSEEVLPVSASCFWDQVETLNQTLFLFLSLTALPYLSTF